MYNTQKLIALKIVW